MPWVERGERDWPRTRQKEPGEPEAEHAFWCRYWEVLRAQGVPAGREIWLEPACHRFIRELKPRRLKEATPEDVTNFLGLLGLQPDSAGWKIRQADQALRILFQELMHCPWAAQWPVGLPELEGWMEGPEGGGKMPVPGDAAQARFAEQINRMVKTLRRLHYSYRTEEAYVGWARRFLSFSLSPGIEELNGDKVRAFLEKLALEAKVSAATQKQALNGLVSFFREGLGKPLGQLGEFAAARRPRKMPVVLSRSEVEKLFSRLSGEHRLMARLLYGSGLRLMDCVRLRVKDIDFERGQIVVRDGKGGKDRVTMLPEVLQAELQEHLKGVKGQHDHDLKAGHGAVSMPEALARKYPNASKDWVCTRVMQKPGLGIRSPLDG